MVSDQVVDIFNVAVRTGQRGRPPRLQIVENQDQIINEFMIPPKVRL